MYVQKASENISRNAHKWHGNAHTDMRAAADANKYLRTLSVRDYEYKLKLHKKMCSWKIVFNCSFCGLSINSANFF